MRAYFVFVQQVSYPLLCQKKSRFDLKKGRLTIQCDDTSRLLMRQFAIVDRAVKLQYNTSVLSVLEGELWQNKQSTGITPHQYLLQ